MPEYKSRKSQSYKKLKNSKNSKSGGRRRKHTMRKYRRGKKVMRGGVGNYPVSINISSTIPKVLLDHLQGTTTSGNVEHIVYGLKENVVNDAYNAAVPLAYRPNVASLDDKRESIIKHVVANTAQGIVNPDDIPDYLKKK